MLPFGGQHADASRVLNDMVPRRLERNAKLHRDLASGQRQFIHQVNGLSMSALTLPFEGEKLEALAGFMARGMALHHFGIVIPSDCNVRSGVLTAVGDQFLGTVSRMNGIRVQQSLGEGAFAYEGLQSEADRHVTIWRFTFYGVVKVGEAPELGGETPMHVYATTSRSAALARMWDGP